MSESIRDRIIHALLALLLSVGLLMPLLGILDPSLQTPDVILWAAVLIIGLEVLCIKPFVAVIGLLLISIIVSVRLVVTGNIDYFTDVFHAVSWRLRGIDSPVAMVSSYIVIVLTVLIAVLCFFSTGRDVSALWASCFCFGMILLIYLTGSDYVIPWFLPALLTLLLQLMTTRFEETPLLPLIPFALIVVLSAFFLSQGNIESKALRDKTDELRQSVMDRLFFTEPRDVFSLSSEGWYPEGQDQLGGKPDPHDNPVMQVSTPCTVYLRGVILNEYTGRSWQNTTGGRRYLRDSSLRSASARAALFDENLPPLTVRNALCDPVTVSVRMLSDSASTLFVPQRVRELFPGGDLVPYYSNSSELFVTRNLKSGDTYSVSAPLFLAGDSGLSTLIEVCSTLEDDRYDQMVSTYTTLPEHLEQPVFSLAREVSSVASSPYDKALAIQSWLSRNFRYTLDVDWQPSDMDFVTRFLLDTKEGYCTHFASAMTVLCRMVCLPARYVEGYLAEPDQNGEAVVTGLSAHAWTEVYFKGFGWLTFDATPKRSSAGDQEGGNRQPDLTPSPSPEPDSGPTPAPTPETSGQTEEEPTPAPDDSVPTPEPTVEPTPENSPEPSVDPDDGIPSPPPDHEQAPQDESGPDGFSFPWLLLPLVLLLLAGILRFWFTSPSFRASRAKTEPGRFDVWAQEVMDLMHAENLDRQTGESPMAFGRRIDRTGLFSVALGPVGECVSLIRYSRAEVSETDTGLIRDTSILIKGELSRPARLRYLLRRFFIPAARRDSL